MNKLAKVFCFFSSEKKNFFFEKKKQKTFAHLPNRPLIFLHLPKSSGIAVTHALLAVERPPRVFFGFDQAFFGGFTDFASVAPENREFIHLSPATLPPDEKFVRAHMSLSTLRAAYPHGRFVTVLREPVSRALSHFAFWRGFSPEQDAAWGGWATRHACARGTLEAFLTAPDLACQVDNVATRLLLWPHKFIPNSAMIDPAHDAVLLAAAKARLADLDFVDVIENPEFYSNLSAWIGAPLVPGRFNETESLPASLQTQLDRELTPHATDLLTARSRLDLALWQSILAARAPRLDRAALRQATLLRATARTALLLGGLV